MLDASVANDIIQGFFAMVAVEMLSLKGASPSSVAVTYEVLETANRLRVLKRRKPLFDIYVTGSGAASTRRFIGLTTRACPAVPDLLVLPAMGWADEAAISAGLERRDSRAAQRRISEAVAGGAEIATSCSGVFILAATGLLDERHATTTWWLAPLFRKWFPSVRLESDALVLVDGPITTAGAAMAHLDLMLAMVSRHGGDELARNCSKFMLLDERRSQARYMAMAHLAAQDEWTMRLGRVARERLPHGLTVERMAAAMGLGSRTFARRLKRSTGLTPVRYLQRLKVERALELIETTRLPFEEIAHCVGYAESSTLRRLLKKQLGTVSRGLRVGSLAASC